MKAAKKDFIKLYMIDLMVSDFIQKENTESSAMFDRSCFCIVDESDIEKEHLSLLPH